MDLLDLLYRASWTVLIIGGALVAAALTLGIFFLIGVDK